MQISTNYKDVVFKDGDENGSILVHQRITPYQALSKMWHGEKKGGRFGLKQAMLNQIYERQWEDFQEREYIIRNLDSVPVPEIFRLFFNDIIVEMSTDFESLEKKMPEKFKQSDRWVKLKTMPKKTSFKFFKVSQDIYDDPGLIINTFARFKELDREIPKCSKIIVTLANPMLFKFE